MLLFSYLVAFQLKEDCYEHGLMESLKTGRTAALNPEQASVT